MPPSADVYSIDVKSIMAWGAGWISEILAALAGPEPESGVCVGFNPGWWPLRGLTRGCLITDVGKQIAEGARLAYFQRSCASSSIG